MVILDNHFPDMLQVSFELGPIEIEKQDSSENIDFPNGFPLYFVKEFYWKNSGYPSLDFNRTCLQGYLEPIAQFFV